MRAVLVAVLPLTLACGPNEPKAAAPQIVLVEDAAAPPPRSAPVAASAAPVPVNVDLELATPDGASIIAEAADGRVLVEIRGWVERSGAYHSPGSVQIGEVVVRGNTSYTAILDAKRDCIEETLATPTLSAASATGTPKEALAVLASPDAHAEVDRLRALAQRFGIHGLGPAVFGPDYSRVVLEANNDLYSATGAGAFAQVPVGTSTRLEASPTGAVTAYAHCGSPCGGVYVPALLDMTTQKSTDFRVGDTHNFHWAKDGKSLYFSQDDRKSGSSKASKVCLGRIDVDAPQPKTIKCLPSTVFSQTISAASPSATFIGLQTESPRAFVVFEMPAGKEAYRINASPIYQDIDDRGRVVFDEIGEDHRYRVRLASSSGEELFPAAKSVGFLRDGSVLVLPNDRPVDPKMMEPLHRLVHRRCGFFATRTSQR
jgi:hypothetical protein